MPTGLRRPEAYTRVLPVAGSSSSTAARLSSASMPFSPTLLLEPTPTYSLTPPGFDPSLLATRLLVQWWLSSSPLPGRSATFTGTALICVSPLRYGTRTTASALAT